MTEAEKIARNVAAGFGAEVTGWRYERRYPATVNSEQETEFAAQAGALLGGQGRVAGHVEFQVAGERRLEAEFARLAGYRFRALVATVSDDGLPKVRPKPKPAVGQETPPALSGGHPDYVPQACEKSLKMLGVEVIDIYGLHRVDPTVPIEDTVGAMAEAVQAGIARARWR